MSHYKYDRNQHITKTNEKASRSSQTPYNCYNSSSRNSASSSRNESRNTRIICRVYWQINISTRTTFKIAASYGLMKKGREYLSSLVSSTKRNNMGQIRRTNFEGEKLQLFRGFLEVGLRHEVDIIGRKSFSPWSSDRNIFIILHETRDAETVTRVWSPPAKLDLFAGWI